MKSVVFVLSILAAVSILGCQDDSSLNPVADQQLAASAAKPGRPMPLYYLPLKGVVSDPRSSSGMTEISGQVELDIVGEALMQVKMYTGAVLIPSDQASDPIPWNIAGKSEDWVKVLDGGYILIKKSYKVEGRNDGAKLHVAVRISRPLTDDTRSVELAKVYLEVPNGFATAQDDTN